MSLDAVKILGISITKSSKNEILEFLQKYLLPNRKSATGNPQSAAKPLIIVTPNPEQIVYAQRDSHFAGLLNQADVAIPDGVGVVWASRFLHQFSIQHSAFSIQQVIPGIDFMEDLVSLAARKRVPVALIGSWGGLAVKALDCLLQKRPELRGWAVDGPETEIVNDELRIMNHGQKKESHNSLFTIHYSNEEEYFKQLALQILRSGVRMVFVALGAPKQEYFIERLKQSLVTSNQKSVIGKRKSDYGLRITDYPIIFMSVGGSFDEIAGSVPRAPRWVSAVGLKWLWRLIRQPWRMKRQLALLEFVWLVLRKRFSLK